VRGDPGAGAHGFARTGGRRLVRPRPDDGVEQEEQAGNGQSGSGQGFLLVTGQLPYYGGDELAVGVVEVLRQAEAPTRLERGEPVRDGTQAAGGVDGF
jgi:hypothetical protein